jgi:hypothetical protein
MGKLLVLRFDLAGLGDGPGFLTSFHCVSLECRFVFYRLTQHVSHTMRLFYLQRISAFIRPSTGRNYKYVLQTYTAVETSAFRMMSEMFKIIVIPIKK